MNRMEQQSAQDDSSAPNNALQAISNGLVHLKAQEAHYYPAGEGRYSGGWLLTDTQPRQLENWNNPAILEMIDPGKYFLYTQEVDLITLTRIDVPSTPIT